MKNTQTIEDNQDQGIFAIFKGTSGSGKSVGALSFPTPCVLDFDRKMPAIALKHFPKKSIDFEQFDKLENITNLVDGWVNGSCPYETIIIDSITSAGQLLITDLSEMMGDSTSKQIQSIRKTKSGESMPEAISIGIYNHEKRFFFYLTDKMKYLWSRPGNPKHVIFIAHVVSVEYNNLVSKVTTKTSSIVTAGKAAAAHIPTQFDNEWVFAFKEEGGLTGESTLRHVVSTRTIGEHTAKCAYNLERLIDFTHPKNLYEEIQLQIKSREWFNG